MKQIRNKLVLITILISMVLGISTIVVKAESGYDEVKRDVQVEKYWDDLQKMPQRNIQGSTGMFPQYYTGTSASTVKLSRARFGLNNWNATVAGEILYCAQYGGYVRFGEYEVTKHYLIPNNTKIQGQDINVPRKVTMAERLQNIENTFKNYVEGQRGVIQVASEDNKSLLTFQEYKALYEKEPEVKYTISWKDELTEEQKNSSAYIVQLKSDIPFNPITDVTEAESIQEVTTDIENVMGTIMSKLEASLSPKSYSDDIDGKIETEVIASNNEIAQPEIMVVQPGEGNSRGYTKGEFGTYTNNKMAYVLTALENVYPRNGNYAKEYSLNDIQMAYWKALGQNPLGGRTSENYAELNKQANLYQNFIEKDLNNYSVTINDDAAKVIANREAKKYIVGPFSINYPQYEDISYIKALTINDTLTYDDEKKQFSLIFQNKGMLGSNGMTTNFPASGENFFVEFSASALNNPTKMELKVFCEYLKKTEMNYYEFKAEANVYRYYAATVEGITVNVAGKDSETFKAETKDITLKAEVLSASTEWGHGEGCDTQNCENNCTGGTQKTANPWIHAEGCDRENCKNNCAGGFDGYTNSWKIYEGTYRLYFPYIQMGKDSVAGTDAQDLIVTAKGKISEEESGGGEFSGGEGSTGIREYKIVNASTTMDLTMELGGIVWEDSDGGKESKSNGILDENERTVPNITVTLYQVGADNKIDKSAPIVVLTQYVGHNKNKEQQIQNPTKTNNDGVYKFTGLNAMYQYYVEFTYNGQYYQPTTYSSSETWGTENWKVNSNATDIRFKRLEYNKGFQTISSYPANYQTKATGNYLIKGNDSNYYNETFSEKELLGFILNADGTYERDETQCVVDEYIDCIDKQNNHNGNPHDADCYQSFGNLKEGMEAKLNDPNTDEITKRKIQFVKDCAIRAYTGKDNDTNGVSIESFVSDAYPVPGVFVIDTVGPLDKENRLGQTKNSPALYPNAYYINLGLDQRQEADISLTKDVYQVRTEINGQVQEYTYNKLEEMFKDEQEEVRWDIRLRLSDVAYNTNQKYYDTKYSREIHLSDYAYDVDNSTNGYGEKAAEFGKTQEDELKVFITYKITVRNSSQSIKLRADEIVDYFDTDLRYVNERSYINVGSGIRLGVGMQEAAKTSNIQQTTQGKPDQIEQYNKLYITGLGKGATIIGLPNGFSLEDESIKKYQEEIKNYGVLLNTGEKADIYLTFEVNKNNEGRILLDETLSGGAIGVGKENMAEINEYSTFYRKNTEIPNVGKVGYVGYIEQDKVDKVVADQINTTAIAGIIDRDSKPGNLMKEDVPKDGTTDAKDPNKTVRYQNFEDDTDKAPNIRIILYRGNENDGSNRVISGTVWEDKRTTNAEYAMVGDGERDDSKEAKINGVTVQLVEIMENGKEFVWREFGDTNNDGGNDNTIKQGTGTGTVTSELPIINLQDENGNGLVSNYTNLEEYNGQYAFKSFVPGKYVVRFIYGDTVRTVLPKGKTVDEIEGEGLNEKSYNGQDFKSTTYQKDVMLDENENKIVTEYTWRADSKWENGQEILGNELTTISTHKEDASNNEKVTFDQKQKGYLYDIQKSDTKNDVSDAKDIESIRNAVNNYSNNEGKGVTNQLAEILASHKESSINKDNLQALMDNTQMTAETGLMVIEIEKYNTDTKDEKENNPSYYKIGNVDLGLEERPKAQLVINKEVSNVKVTLADGSILFDAKDTAKNVLWKEHTPHKVTYDRNNMIDYIEESNQQAKFGLIQLSMDEELMHGATMEITYTITVQNKGEVDYYQKDENDKIISDRLFYYTGKVTGTAKVVTTQANQVIDYVANNLQFNQERNQERNQENEWSVITTKKLIEDEKLVKSNLKEKVETYNTIIETTKLNTELEPGIVNMETNSVSVPLVLTQLITSENETDDLTYRNIVEIVKTSNTLGRRNEFSVVGNQDPTENPQELDAYEAETVKILPPFGNAGIYFTIAVVIFVAVGILIGGIIFIKKKVLHK